MPMGTSWSWVPNEQYKSTDEIIRTLVSVVSRGGSLLLNVAPGPDGQLDSTAYVRLKEVGEWMKVNGEAVYGTRPSRYNAPTAALGSSEKVMSSRSGEEKHIMYVFLDGSSAEVRMDMHALRRAPEVKLLGSTSQLKWQKITATGVIVIPADPDPDRVRVLRINARLPVGIKKL